ncbi:MAG: dephospho-CoA kinase [Bacillota bacterium]|jgi:dephospho-CoA kinase|nr:dephospho-CoA kinase [Bacillota bacterium]HHT91454.1 dephospho-CoA kinase [Bacillota bacterium]
MIGITGGIASGKSAVSERLRHLGAVVLDADRLAREVVKPLTPGWVMVKQAFPEVIQEDLEIDRKRLGQIVFAQTAKRQLLESIIHPQVLEELLRQAKHEEQGGRTVFAEVPLLYEVGWEQYMEEVWVVYIPQELQLKRLISRARLSEADALQRIASQMPLEEKKQRAKKVIDNSGSLAETFRQVDALWQELSSAFPS